MPDLTPESVAAAFESAWAAVAATIEHDHRARVSGTQAALARQLASDVARRLGLPLVEAELPARPQRPCVRWAPGDPDLARPARISLLTSDPPAEHELARVRWLPRSLYRALGFLLHAQRDADALTEAQQGSASPYTPWVFLVDLVGAIEQGDVDRIARRETPVSVRAWTLRHGRLSSSDQPEPKT